MRIIEVTPIAQNITRETLSYFTSKEIEGGSIVIVPIRNKLVPAIVIETKSVSENKTDIKNANFQIKKIENVETISFLSNAHLKAAKKTADFFCGTMGSVINTFAPNAVLREIQRLYPSKEDNTF